MPTLVPSMTEAQFQRQVVEYAEWNGWLTYHTYDSRRSNAGFPDLVMVRDKRVVFAELKSEKGRWTDTQRMWALCLGRVADASQGAVDVYVWRPSDWPVIEKVLGR